MAKDIRRSGVKTDFTPDSLNLTERGKDNEKR